MTAARIGPSGIFFAVATITEALVGLGMVVDPAFVIGLVLGADLSGTGTLVGRFFGIALLALVAACWPGRDLAPSGARVFAGLLVYNIAFAVFVAYLGTSGNFRGVLLWPAVAFHAAVAVWLIVVWRARLS